MRLNWIGYQFRDFDGYGRFGPSIILALRRLGVEVQPLFAEVAYAPEWIQREMGANWDDLTISCLPVYFSRRIPGRHWMWSMTEGSGIPSDWAPQILQTDCERMIVPCNYNYTGFWRGLADIHHHIPIHVIPGGTDPGEFYPETPDPEDKDRPYTFIALGDRGGRKGWVETYQAFYDTFGTPRDTADVALVIKVRPDSNEMLDRMHNIMTDPEQEYPDPRVRVWIENVSHPSDIWREADCVVMPSRSEGWGMPHREAAMMGIPVISHRYGALNDGTLDKWSIPVEKGVIEPIPPDAEQIAGNWRRPDIEEIGQHMLWCYANRKAAKDQAFEGAEWLATHQTWDHTAQALVDMIETWH